MCKCKHKVIKQIPGKQRGFNYLVECPVCNKHFQISGSHFNNGQRIFCSASCRAKGVKKKPYRFSVGNGKYKLRNGYVFYRVKRGVYMYEHRYIMEQHLGRKLESHEHVHHRNHDKTDNRIENLELTTASQNAKYAVEFYGLRPKDSVTGRFT